MNKTLIRAVKREYAEYFELYCNLTQKEYPVPFKRFLPQLDEYATYILGWEDKADIDKNYRGLKNLSKFLGIFIDYCKMKKILTSQADKNLMKNFYDLLYSYSHHKFNAMMKYPEIRFLIRKMLSREYIDQMISKNSTLSEKASNYKECAAIIVANIDHFNYKKRRTQ